MATRPSRRPPSPDPAERAKSIAARPCPATVRTIGCGATETRAVEPAMHHVHANASVSLVLAADHPLVTAATTDTDLATLVELADLAPVELRERTRALLWITGKLRVLNEATSRARAIMIAETNPHPNLLDIGNGARMLCLHPSSVVLADSDGTYKLRPHRFAEAEPDPFSTQETAWLKHLEADHADVIEALGQHLPPHLREGAIRPLGLDKYGLRLRVEAEAGDHDVRLAFDRPARNQQDVGAELRRLVGCPFLAARRGS